MTLNDYIANLRGKKVAVIGYGVSNKPLVNLLLVSGIELTVCDKRSIADMGQDAFELLNRGAKLKLGDNYLDGLDQDVIFRTPGLLPFDSHLEAARGRGSVVTSEMEVFFAVCPCKVIAVTGSDGKTTTTTIISELLKAQGHTVHLGGNIGKPLLCEAPIMCPEDYVVLELSSFQLHSMYCRPDVAVITNISPNHLDKHKDYQDYIDSKMAVFLNQNAGDKLVLNQNDGQTQYYAEHAAGSVVYFSDAGKPQNGSFEENGVLYRVTAGNTVPVVKADEILIPGQHNVQNYLAAFAATDGIVSAEICKQVAVSFTGVEHRLEKVRLVHGVQFINDSIASSPSRVAAGLRALSKKPIIICGGYDKHIPFDSLGDDLCVRAKRIFLTGATAEAIKTAVLNSKFYTADVDLRMVDDFDTCVLNAYESASDGDIVLLSPACAAFDRFKNFMERGRHFKQLVMEIDE